MAKKAEIASTCSMESEWQLQDDVRTIMQYQKLRTDAKRHGRATSFLNETAAAEKSRKTSRTVRRSGR